MNTIELEKLAAVLEESKDYRVLRRLKSVDSYNEVDGTPTKVGLVIDVETTGLNAAVDEIIELGMVKFEFSADGRVFRIIDRFSQLREPRIPIPPEVVTLTGITSDTVAGHAISEDTIAAFTADAVLVIAHNAAFDRQFCEQAWSSFASKHWACSSSEIGWRSHGRHGTRLAYLLGELGYFSDSHRALNDCEALLAVLNGSSPVGGTYLAELLANARRSTIRIAAEGAPFEYKDALKARGYRWFEANEERVKSWRKDVYEEDLTAELDFLRSNVFGGKQVELPLQKFTAIDRYSLRAQ
ncbi:3'-5' exonuclease [Hyphomicrobium sp. 802]|uniref:3'-5' exonuclease n=1 Tax=Hyphomicrobium sp. 802 TaxID=1112272 RepID=UPI00045EC447|nr:3'-5' exonuclease [Hyphomicrobium sp. 802]